MACWRAFAHRALRLLVRRNQYLLAHPSSVNGHEAVAIVYGTRRDPEVSLAGDNGVADCFHPMVIVTAI
jgi:hypothetical protein